MNTVWDTYFIWNTVMVHALGRIKEIFYEEEMAAMAGCGCVWGGGDWSNAGRNHGGLMPIIGG